jgi:hypothetical protein
VDALTASSRLGMMILPLAHRRLPARGGRLGTSRKTKPWPGDLLLPVSRGRRSLGLPLPAAEAALSQSTAADSRAMTAAQAAAALAVLGTAVTTARRRPPRRASANAVSHQERDPLTATS